MSCELTVPPSAAPAKCLLVLAHGAGAGYTHAHMHALAAALGRAGIASLRFNFPFIEMGRRRVDSKADSIAAIAAAVESGCSVGLPLVLGGHSFGGRMASHAVVELGLQPTALVYFSFPLHAAKNPATQRAAHLPQVSIPQLFVSGTRDALAEPALLEGVISDLTSVQAAAAQIHWLEGADHGFKTRKRDRLDMPDVYDEAAEAVASFVQPLL